MVYHKIDMNNLENKINNKKKTVLITGSSNGIGLATAKYYLDRGFIVYGLDKEENTSINNDDYHHYKIDLLEKDLYPEIDNVSILINNAGVQNSNDDISNNLRTVIYVTEKYALNNEHIESVLFNASASAHTGFEFGEYSASKAGVIGYMKHCSWILAKKYKATCNSISCGGVITDLNKEVMDDEDLWNQIMDVTPLKRWSTSKEVAEWIYFLTVINKSCTGQDILIDNGEKDLNCTFVWPDFN